MAEDVNEGRRAFLNRAKYAGIAAVGSTALLAGTDKHHERGEKSGGGVVVGKSKKNETLYRKTHQWEDYYKSAL